MRLNLTGGSRCLALAALALLGACGSDSDGGSDCYEGCESAADRAACVAACDSAADASGDGTSTADTATGDDTAETDADPSDATVETDTTTNTDATIEPDDASDDDTTPPPTPEFINIVSCYSAAICYFQAEAILSGAGEDCFSRAHPAEYADTRAFVDCALEQCGDDVASGSAAVVACASVLCPNQYAACDDVPAASPGCGETSDCLSGCDKSDAECRAQCLGSAPDAIAAATALGYQSCTDSCFALAEPVACVARDCAALDESCYGDDPDWNCPSVYSCLASCDASEECPAECLSGASARRVSEAVAELFDCVVGAGCRTGDVEIDALCTQESCATLWNYCHP